MTRLQQQIGHAEAVFLLDNTGEAIGSGNNRVVATRLGTGRKVRFPVALRTSREALSKKLP